MIQLVISSTIIEQVSLETACIHSKFRLVETTFPLSLARYAWHKTRKRKSGGKYNKHFPAPIPSFLLPKRRFATLQLHLSPSALGSQAIPSAGAGHGWASSWLCQRVAKTFFSRRGQGAAQKSWFLHPDAASCHQRLVKLSWFHNWLCLGWLSCASSHTQLQQGPEVSIFSLHPLWSSRECVFMQGVPAMEIAWLLGLTGSLR